MSWVVAAAALVGYAAPTVAWSEARVGFGFSLSPYVATIVPPLAYALFVMIVFPHARPARLVLGTCALCVVHVVLSFLTASLLVTTSAVPYGAALARAFFEFPLALLPQLVFAPLVLAPLGRFLVPPPPPAGRIRPALRAPVSRPSPAPTIAAAIADTTRAAKSAPDVAAGRSMEPSAEPATGGERGRQSTTMTEVVLHAPAPPPPAVERKDVVRIPFDRIADQIPSETSGAPRERLAAGLHEPGYLLIPRRLILPQLAEGVIDIPWDVVANQFSRGAFTVSDADVARRISHGRLRLPIDEVVRQLPREVFSLPALPPDLSKLAQFAAPFEPGSSSAPSANPPTAAIAASARTPLAREPLPPPLPRADAEALTSADGNGRVALATPAGAPGERGERRSAGVDSNKIATHFEPFGVLEVHSEVIGDITLTAVAVPGLPIRESAKTAARLVPLLSAAASVGPMDQATLRGANGAVIVTPFAPSGGRRALVTLARRSASLALLEILSRRAAAEFRISGEPAFTGQSANAEARAALQLTDDDADLRRDVPDGSLSAFGPGEISRFRSVGRDLLLYVFRPSGLAARPLAEYAWNVCHAVGLADATAGDGPSYSSIVLRQKTRWVVIRPFAVTQSGRRALLVATGEVSRPGLAHRQIETMAERLRSL